MHDKEIKTVWQLLVSRVKWSSLQWTLIPHKYHKIKIKYLHNICVCVFVTIWGFSHLVINNKRERLVNTLENWICKCELWNFLGNCFALSHHQSLTKVPKRFFNISWQRRMGGWALPLGQKPVFFTCLNSHSKICYTLTTEKKKEKKKSVCVRKEK